MWSWFIAALLAGVPVAAFPATPSVLISKRFLQPAQANIFDIKTDAAGNIYVCGTTFLPGVPLVRPLQTTGAIFVMKLDAAASQVIYSTMVGAATGDSLGGMTVDAAGNVYVVGTTSSPNLAVTPGALQPRFGGVLDAFVIKLAPDGQRLLYASYLGGPDKDIGYAVAVDAVGAMYVAAISELGHFPVTAGGDLASDGMPCLFVSKLVPDGTWLQYSTRADHSSGFRVKLVVTSLTEATVLIDDNLGSRVLKLNAAGNRLVYRSVLPAPLVLGGLASDATGNIWLAGAAAAGGLATPDAAQSRLATAAYFRSDPTGANFTAGGLDASVINQLLPVGGALYAATEQGLYRSTDNGSSWVQILNDPALRLAADPEADGTLYVLRRGATPMAKTMDGGATWQSLDPQAPQFPFVQALAIDPTHPSTIYAGAGKVYRSDDGGTTWTASGDLPGEGITSLAVDPSNPSVVYASLSPQYVGCGIVPCIPVTSAIMRSTDGGRTFQGSSIMNYVGGFALDPVHPGTAYAGGALLYRTTDYGAHWDWLRGPDTPGGYQFPAVAVEESGALLVLAGDGRVFRSDDGGETFSALTDFPIYGATTLARSGGFIHLGGRRGANAIVAKLDWSGNIVYATYWGGHVQESASAVDVDSGGNVYVAGSGVSPDFPAPNSVRDYAGRGDAFLLKLDPLGVPLYATFWGGSAGEQVASVTAGPGGSVYFAGDTGSMDFPVSGGAPSSGPGTMFLVGMR